MRLEHFMVLEILRRVAAFSFVKPARETLYELVPRRDKYRLKSFIDTVVFKLGNVSGALASPIVASLSLRHKQLVQLVFIGVWAFCACQLLHLRIQRIQISDKKHSI